MYVSSGVGQEFISIPLPPATTTDYCSNLPNNMCAITQDVINRAKERCELKRQRENIRGVGLGRVCTYSTSANKVGSHNENLWDPCAVAALQVCAPGNSTLPPPSDDTPVPVIEEPEEEEDRSAYVIGGILGLLVLGAVGYSVFKNRKKKGKR